MITDHLHYARIASVLKSLSRPSRVRLLAMITRLPDPPTFTELRDLSGISPSSLSDHLRALTDSGLLRGTAGREATYTMERAALREATTFLVRLCGALDDATGKAVTPSSNMTVTGSGNPNQAGGSP